MVDYNNDKDIFGMIFIVLSIVILAYMFISPLNHLITHIDEYFTMTVINFPVLDIISITGNDVHPPLYYLMLKLATKLFASIGISKLYLVKLISVIPYLLIIVVALTKVRNEYGWLTAGLFTFTLGVMSEFFAYYMMARMYSWGILFLVLAFIYFKDVIEKNDIKSWALLTVFAVLCAYTHYFAAISAVVIYAILLGYILTQDKDMIKNYACSVVAAIILYAPWIFVLFGQLTAVHNSYWIPAVDLNLVISALGYFAHGEDLLFAVIALIVIFAIIGIFAYENRNLKDRDNFYILSGFGVFFGTVILTLLISVVFKPILVVRYLMPAAAVLWFAVSILISKIENRKLFLYAFALMGLLLIAGVGHTVSFNMESYDAAMAKENVFNEIIQDNNSVLILTKPNTIMYFLDYSDKVDTYCVNHTHVLGQNMKHVHKLMNFTDINETKVSDFVKNNTNKTVYLITWGDFNLTKDINRTSLLSDRGIDISKLTYTPPQEEEYSEEDYY